MEIKSMRLPRAVENVLTWVVVVVTAPVWAPLAAFVWLVAKLEAWMDPPRWHRVFAFWPVECDAWPDEGFEGWVWLETVWRNKNAPGWTPYRREAPQVERDKSREEPSQ